MECTCQILQQTMVAMPVRAVHKRSKVIKREASPKHASNENRVPLNTTPWPAVSQSASGVLSPLDYNFAVSANVASSMASQTINAGSPVSPYRDWVTGRSSNQSPNTAYPPCLSWSRLYSPHNWN